MGHDYVRRKTLVNFVYSKCPVLKDTASNYFNLKCVGLGHNSYFKIVSYLLCIMLLNRNDNIIYRYWSALLHLNPSKDNNITNPSSRTQKQPSLIKVTLCLSRHICPSLQSIWNKWKTRYLLNRFVRNQHIICLKFVAHKAHGL